MFYDARSCLAFQRAYASGMQTAQGR